MSRINIGLVVGVVILVILNIFQFVFWRNSNTQTTEKYTAEIANLEQTVASYGDPVEVYTVIKSVKPGDPITVENVETMRMYSSMLTEQYVTNMNDIVGRYFKVAVNPGTAITKDMAMDEELQDSMRERDIVVDRATVGLQVGDYIDIRITMPYGDDYVVIPHKRVYGIGEATIKLHLNELEWNTYIGAMVDYALNQTYGCVVYADKYVEPGIQQEAINFYAVPTNIAALLQKNPNIIDKEEAASLNEWRASLEELLVIFRTSDDTVDADGGRLAANRAQLNEAVESDRATDAEVRAEQEALEQEQGGDYEEVPEDFWSEDPASGSTQTGEVMQ